MTPADLKPIETMYHGIRYRSKLEACWAACFHHLQLPFEYELNGYDLPSGYYLPDFMLPDLGRGRSLWIEIKPMRQDLACGLDAPYRELAELSRLPVLLLWGSPITHASVPCSSGILWSTSTDPVNDEDPPHVIRGLSFVQAVRACGEEVSESSMTYAAVEAHRACRWNPAPPPVLPDELERMWKGFGDDD